MSDYEGEGATYDQGSHGSHGAHGAHSSQAKTSGVQNTPAPASAKKDEDFVDKGLNAGLKKFGGDKYKDPEKNKETNNAIKKAFKQVFKIFMRSQKYSV